MNLYIGVDPGVSGGIAAIDHQGKVVRATKMPLTEVDLLTEFKMLVEFVGAKVAEGEHVIAVLERVHAGVFGHGKQGKMGVSSAFTFGKGVGHLQMALTAAGISYDEVLPVTWQSALSCRTGGDKNISKRRAQQIFLPSNLTITHAIADALLMAEYCRRYTLGMLTKPSATEKRGTRGKA